MADDDATPRRPRRWSPPVEMPAEGIARAIGVGRDLPPRSLRPDEAPVRERPPGAAGPPGVAGRSPSGGDRSAEPGGEPVTTRHRRRRRWLIGAALLAVLGLAATILSIVYAAYRVGQVQRVSVSGLVPAGPGSAQTILLAGSDSRAGESAGAAAQFGSASQVAGARSDVIILIHLDPGAGSASMLSIPRDLFVPIAGTSGSNRINTAFDTSPSQLVKTISADFGITINHFAQENFGGLQSLTDAVGGVCMSFPYPVRDGSPTGTGNESGLNIPVAGKRVLNGSAALSLVRSRYYQYEVNGLWKAEGTGDIGRITRQHEFMRALASKALHASLRNPFTANAVVGRAVKDVTVDTTFTSFGILRLALNLRSLRPAGMPSWTMPYVAVNNYKGYGDVLMPDPAQDGAVIAAWRDYRRSAAVPPTTINPASVSVQVLNGSGVAGQAAATAAALKAVGFSVPKAVATAPAPIGASSLIAYGPGQKAGAEAVAAHIGGPYTVRADGRVTGVVLTTGTGFQLAPTAPKAQPAAGNASSASTTPPWDPKPC